MSALEASTAGGADIGSTSGLRYEGSVVADSDRTNGWRIPPAPPAAAAAAATAAEAEAGAPRPRLVLIALGRTPGGSLMIMGAVGVAAPLAAVAPPTPPAPPPPPPAEEEDNGIDDSKAAVGNDLLSSLAGARCDWRERRGSFIEVDVVNVASRTAP